MIKKDITFENMRWVKKMVTQLIVYLIVYFKNYYQMIAIDLSKLQAIDADPKAIQ